MPTTANPPAPAGATTPPPVTGWPRPLRWTVALFHAVNATGVFAGRCSFAASSWSKAR